jgi:branched-chain amino acid transport system permease protein
MNPQIALFLAQDGLTSGAVYILMALALVLVFSVTRVLFLPQGQFFVYGALTLAAMQGGAGRATAWLLLGLGALTFIVDVAVALRHGRSLRSCMRSLGWNLLYPAGMLMMLSQLDLQNLPLPLQILFTVALVTPMGAMVYRLCFQPVADASVITLLILAVSVDFVMLGLGLLFFGAEGYRTKPFTDVRLDIGGMPIALQSLWILVATAALVGALYLFFGHSPHGKALRATAFNRVGARLMGIRPSAAGKTCFLMAAFIGALSGILSSPVTTVYYDTGFIVGLKGFVGAILGGLVSYPLAAVGAVFVGLIEAFSSFQWSSYKDAVVFSMIIPVLIWRSLKSHVIEEDEE